MGNLNNGKDLIATDKQLVNAKIVLWFAALIAVCVVVALVLYLFQ